MNPIKLYYYNVHRRDPSARTRECWGNFGDEISPLLIERLFGCSVEYAPYERCELMAVGSILGRAALYKPHHFLKPSKWLSRDIAVWGSGMLSPYRHFGLCRLQFHAVRGALTQALIPSKNSMPEMALGDPGLLADHLLSDAQRHVKKYAVGLIPHIRDQALPQLKALTERRKDCCVINVLRHPCDVIEAISQCECVYSSSLHGLIVADSLGVPNAWFRGCDEIAGRSFKFLDYYSVFGINTMTPVELSSALLEKSALDDLAARHERKGLAKIKADLLESFPFDG